MLDPRQSLWQSARTSIMSEYPLILAPSILAADFANLARDITHVEEAGADWLHVDVMDGHFVPNISIGPPVVASVNSAANIPLDVHLMITDPAAYAEEFVKAGADVLTFHREVCDSPDAVREMIKRFRDAGVKQVGMALNPATPAEEAADFIGELDLILVMSVVPGFGGQSFMSEVLEKVSWLREAGFEGHLEMDGGLNAETLPLCAAAGANCLVAGSAIFGAKDIPKTIGEFRRLGEIALAGRSPREVS